MECQYSWEGLYMVTSLSYNSSTILQKKIFLYFTHDSHALTVIQQPPDRCYSETPGLSKTTRGIWCSVSVRVLCSLSVQMYRVWKKQRLLTLCKETWSSWLCLVQHTLKNVLRQNEMKILTKSNRLVRQSKWLAADCLFCCYKIAERYTQQKNNLLGEHNKIMLGQLNTFELL